ncbi:MAG: hypothetical protein IJW26_06530, partial [Clostridia bacterium]|nr:hypothetical protein [Clostridia bacterium]
KVAYLSLKPSCTKEEFLEADYLEFYMYLHAKNNQNNDGSEVTLSMFAGNVRIFNCDANAWVYVKVPLDIYKYSRSATITSYNNGAGVNSREEFYEYLSAGQPFLYTNATLKHLATEDMTYKMYFSDLKMKVETPDDGHTRLRNNFAKLNEEQLLPDKQVKVLKNIFPRYYSNALNINDYVNYDGVDVVKMSIGLNKWQSTNVNTLTNIMYVQVNPSKSLKQIAQYDALAVTMRVDTQNPNPLVAMLDYPTKYATDKNNVLARFSANKWITFEIPVELLIAMYPYMENTCVYEIPGNTYTWLNQVQELFYITYEYNGDGSLKYARDVYQAKTKLDGGTAKWTDVPCLGEELRPYKQGGWIQYPINVYIKSLKLIKKATE